MTDASIEQANEIHCYEYSSSNVLRKHVQDRAGVCFDDIEALLASSGFVSKQEVAPSYRAAESKCEPPIPRRVPGVRTRH